MANRPANAGAHSAGPQRGPAAAPPVRPDAPPPVRQDAPPPVHHQGFPRSRTAPARRRAAPARRGTPVLAWLPYLIVLAGVAAGLFVTGQGSLDAGLGAAVVGGALLVAAAARLLLPPDHAGPLASRGKALDVAIFAVLGTAVLGAALSLP
jgi:hypothetical protein